jgi:hypothetical protein
MVWVSMRTRMERTGNTTGVLGVENQKGKAMARTRERARADGMNANALSLYV